MKNLFFTLFICLVFSSSFGQISPIFGYNYICQGSTSHLASGTPGGIWSIANPAIATVDVSGNVTGVAVGTTTLTYTVGTAYVTAGIVINPLPSHIYTISGSGSRCIGTAGLPISINNSDVGINYWLVSLVSSYSYSFAGTGGPMSVGTGSEYQYIVQAEIPSTHCRINMHDTVTIITNTTPPPTAPAYYVCPGGSYQLTDAVPGGVWTSTAPLIASVGSTGIYTGHNNGQAVISYTAATGCVGTATVNVTIIAPVTVGTKSVCTGATTVLGDPAGLRGVFTCLNPGIATINSGGAVTGITAGLATISYSLGSTSCSVNSIVTVNPAANVAGVIPGSAALHMCDGDTITYVGTPAGGTWSIPFYTDYWIDVSTTGTSLKIKAGPFHSLSYASLHDVYTVPGGCQAAINVEVYPTSNILGPSTMCAGASATLYDSLGGTWSSGSPSLATIGSSTGIMTALSSGLVTITNTNAYGCNTTSTLNIIPASCTGTPTGGTATATATSVCTGTLVTVSLSGHSTNCGIVYQWQNSADGISFIDITGATSTSYTYTVSLSKYLRCRVTCTNTGLFANSTMIGIAAANHMTHTVYDSLCNTPNFYVSACGVASTFNVTTWFGDGTSVNTHLTSSGICHADVFHNYYQPGHYFIKQVLYLGTLPQDSVRYTYEYAYCNTFPIRFFYDVNNNCNFDNGEMPMSQPTTTQVDSNGVPVATISSTSGFYYKALGPIGTVYRFHVTQIPSSLHVSCPAGGYIYDTVVPDTRNYVPKLFAINCATSSGYDMAVHASTFPGRHAIVSYINVSNSFCIPQDGTLTLYCSPKFNFSRSTPAPTTISGNKVTWNLHNIAANAATGIDLLLEVPHPEITANWAHPGDTVQTKYIINGTATGDVDTVNNVVIQVDTIKSSYDPNDIAVSPSGPVIPCTPLQYTIQFENTGNDTAHNIIVMDTLSAYLDPNTLTIEAASAMMNVVNIKNGSQNIVKFEFPNINLLDTSRHSNSGGLVIFNIKTKPGLADGTAINNYAGIFFDDNPAVLTNTVQNTIGLNPVAGSSTVCIGASDTLANLSAGGVWSISNTHASITSGIVTGLAAGLDTVTYTVSNSCGSRSASKIISVNTVPNTTPITGTGTVCAGSSVTLTNSNTGGTWSTSDGTVAGVVAGVVTGIAAGTASIMYTLSNACGSASSVKNITVNPLPTAAPITGAGSVCAGSSVSLSDITPAGAWTTDNAGIATVTSGLVNGISAGTANISYTVTNSCGSSAVTKSIVVNAPPAVAPLTGAGSVCESASITLANTTAGGTWSTSDARTATVAAGIVTGIAAGVADITYAVSNSCGSVNAVKTVTVNPLPVTAPITGAGNVCTGTSVTLSDVTTGGVWTTSNNSIASVTGGVVNGISAGTVDISYTTSNSCGTSVAVKSIIVNTLPYSAPITGPSNVCVGSSITLGDITTGGNWSSSNAGVATVTGGVVNGITAGSVTITYTVSSTCGTAFAMQTINVNPLPVAAPITGPGDVCPGSSITLSNVSSGGIWSSGNPLIATVSGGSVSGVATGTTQISYTVTNGCGSDVAYKIITVNALPFAAPITGLGTVCEGASITLSDITAGGTWSTSDVSIATISAGLLHSVSAGIVVITYTVNSLCGLASVSKSVLVKPLPATAAITGASDVCVGSSIVLNDAVSGGTWTSGNNTVATVSSGTVTGLSAGLAVISYATTNDCGTIFQTKNITVNPNPASITGAAAVCAGSYEVYNNADAGGTWMSGSTSVASINSSGGALLGAAPGVTTITYTLPTGCQTAKQITINVLPAVFNLTGGGAYCNGGTGVHIGLSSSEPGIEYLLKIGNTTINSVTGTGSAIDFGLLTTEATFNVQAVNTATGCLSYMNGTADVSKTPNVTPTVTLTKSPELMTCIGTPVTFTATSVNGGVAPIYTWKVNGSYAATGSSYTYLPATSDVVIVTLASSADCALPASVSAGSTMVVVSPLHPRVTVVYDGTPVVSGQPLKLDATVSGYSSVINYQWVVNQTYLAGATNSSYTSSDFNNNDTVSCIITTSNICGMAIGAGYSVINVNTTAIGSVNLIDDIQISPNPNKGLFTVKGSIKASSDDDLFAEIKNLLGQTVYSKILNTRNGEFAETIQLDKSIANGVYLLTLRAGEQTKTFRIIVGQ